MMQGFGSSMQGVESRCKGIGIAMQGSRKSMQGYRTALQGYPKGDARVPEGRPDHVKVDARWAIRRCKVSEMCKVTRIIGDGPLVMMRESV